MRKWSIFFLVIIISTLSTVAYTTENTISTTTEIDNTQRTLIAVGDLNFADGLGAKILKDPNYPWVGTKEILDSANILVGNLEVPLSRRGKPYTEKTWILRADPLTAQALVTAGFDVVTLANNHIMDYGPLALEDTINTLKSINLLYTGAGMNLNEARRAAFIRTTDGTTFAFLAYSLTFPDLFWATASRPGTAHGGPDNFIPDIKKAKEFADFVVVSFHWSSEMLNYAKPYQKSYAKQCIDAGATIVLGHHPHVLQGLEVYKGGLIAYSLGNFAFGSLSNKVKDSIILAIDYDKYGLTQARLYPVNINNYEVAFQTKRRYGQDAERVLQDLRIFSADFKTQIESVNGVGIIKIR